MLPLSRAASRKGLCFSPNERVFLSILSKGADAINCSISPNHSAPQDFKQIRANQTTDDAYG